MDFPAGFVDGDIEAFEALFREHQADVHRWIAALVRDGAIAEDLTIETFWRIYRSRATFDPGRSFRAWARQIATNVARDYMARRRQEVELPEHLADPGRPDPVVTREIARQVRRAVADLPAKYRLVAMLSLVDEQPQREIAAALGIPVGTVKSRLFHAIRLLRRKLQRLGITP
jgi:RNA polymerase sigma-70 factor (ECF subfamily)